MFRCICVLVIFLLVMGRPELPVKDKR